ncbi:molybdopterin converting factor subunit 1 [Alkalibacillus salilacus]|uniref:Molybdopterin synthase sulfur carrier subunit n=1 Tax=Alkalibacillus salilacus TaxID=284582 RepID=A0ABT9VBE4_9BACI|nr:molybdopterin converting factor subunit 1 [Alkalibacillus salilacus]MDQ0158277.1 molybdopterin synthase sulfur carrier subunit [Alkalibacillus salilacus]
MNKVLYFANLKEATGRKEEAMDVAGMTLGQLEENLAERYPNMTMTGVRFAVNEEFALRDEVIETHDTIALIPPVSGG